MAGLRLQCLFNTFLLIFFVHFSVSLETNRCKRQPLNRYTLTWCGGRGVALQCNGTNQTTVPVFLPPSGNLTTPVCVLDLSHNQIQNVTDDAFVNVSEVKRLSLSNNTISTIQANAFRGLSNLKKIDLSNNNLTWPDSFGKGIFSPLTNVTNINLKNNPITTFARLDKAMLPMQNLQWLQINGCINCSFGENFTDLTRLRNISLSSRLKNACKMGIITNITFQNMPQIHGLWISGCGIDLIEPGAFENLKMLRILDLSYNEKLTFDGLNTCLYGMRNHAHLGILIVAGIHASYGMGTKLKVKHIQNLKTLQSLTTLHLDVNKIEVFDEKILYPEYQLPKSLRSLNLVGNRLTFDLYVEYLYNATNITFLDISRQHTPFYIIKHLHYEPENIASIMEEKVQVVGPMMYKDMSPRTIHIPRDLKMIKWHKSFLYVTFLPDLVFVGAENLEEMDLSFNLIKNWQGAITGLEKLRVLNLADNLCHNVSSKFFSAMPNLEILNISGNSLASSFTLAGYLFSQRMKIRELDISRNDVRSFPTNFFINLLALERLYLRQNSLEDLDFKLRTDICLKTLDLSFNKLKDLPSELTGYLDEMSRGNCRHVSISMVGNPIECTCDTLDFLRWVRDTSVNVHFGMIDRCNMKGHEHLQLNNPDVVLKIIARLEEECQNFTWLWVFCAIVVTCLVTITSCRFLYRYRWKLRYLYYNRNRRHVLEGFERLFENDAFTSYASSKCSFMKNQFVPTLEGEKFKLRLWTADRNSQAGASQAENIVHAINNSRKSILLVDRYYLKDGWCDYEMHMARIESIESRRPVIIIVLFDCVCLSDLPSSIFRSFHDEQVFEFPSADTKKILDDFWLKLSEAIKE